MQRSGDGTGKAPGGGVAWTPRAWEARLGKSTRKVIDACRGGMPKYSLAWITE